MLAALKGEGGTCWDEIINFCTTMGFPARAIKMYANSVGLGKGKWDKPKSNKNTRRQRREIELLPANDGPSTAAVVR